MCKSFRSSFCGETELVHVDCQLYSLLLHLFPSSTLRLLLPLLCCVSFSFSAFGFTLINPQVFPFSRPLPRFNPVSVFDSVLSRSCRPNEAFGDHGM